jgi:hypothetical protein
MVVRHVPKFRGRSFKIHLGRILVSDMILLCLAKFEKSVFNLWPLKIVCLFERMVVTFCGQISRNYFYMDNALTGSESYKGKCITWAWYWNRLAKSELVTVSVFKLRNFWSMQKVLESMFRPPHTLASYGVSSGRSKYVCSGCKNNILTFVASYLLHGLLVAVCKWIEQMLSFFLYN